MVAKQRMILIGKMEGYTALQGQVNPATAAMAALHARPN